METILFGVVPVLAFLGLATRSALRGRLARPGAGARPPRPPHRAEADGAAPGIFEPDPADPTRGGR